MEKLYKASSNPQYLPEFVLDEMADLMYGAQTTDSCDLLPFPDVTPVLVDDDNSMCYPCATNTNTNNSLTKVDGEEKVKSDRQTKKSIGSGNPLSEMAFWTGWI